MASRNVIVVGSGLSGLTAGALLAKRGLGVTLLERCDRPGGSCSAFRREGVTFDLGAAMLFGFGERGFNPHRWVMAELGEPIDVYRHEALYRLNYGSRPVVFWPDVERFVGELVALFPESGGELRAFYAAIMELYDKVIGGVPVFEAPTETPPRELFRRFLSDPIRQLRMIGLLFRNAESLMAPYVRDPAVRRFFDKLTSTYCYTTLEETPAILAATMFSDNHVGGSYYPAGSPMALSARLEKALEKFGGSIRYRAEVESLLGAGSGAARGRGRVAGVALAGGEELRSDAVIFAGAVRNLASRIAPPGLLPAAWAERILAMDMSFPSFVTYGTLDAARLPAGFMPVEMFVQNEAALDEGDVTLYLSALEDPSLAPPGVLPFLLIGPSFGAWPAPLSPGDRSPAYAAAKEAEMDRMIGLVEARRPGFAAAVTRRLGGSPTTIERYLAKPGGSVAGPKQRMGQHLMRRPGARGPVPGLYLCGESTVMGTGTPAVTVSGISAANALLRDLGLEPYRSRGGMAQAVRIIPRGSRGNEPASEEGLLARLCQWCEDSPCQAACPYSLDIPGLMRRLEANNLEGARAILESAAPGGKPCAICAAGGPGLHEPAERPCETACVRRAFAGESVPIPSILSAAGAVARGDSGDAYRSGQ